MNQQLNQFEQSEQPSYQASAPEPKHFLNKKFIITFVVLILLGGAAYAGIWLWQKQQLANEVVPTFTPRADDTTGWKTYTNTQYGFEFRFPSELKGNTIGTDFSGSISGNSTNISVKVVDSKDFAILHPDFSKIMNTHSIKVNGINVKQYYNGNNEFAYITIDKVPTKTIEFFAELSYVDLDQILSTFKFTR